jgi:hypothetical protein
MSDGLEPRALARLGEEARLSVLEVRRAAEQLEAAEARRALAVGSARAYGASWDLIGWALGVTGEGARQRWGVRGDS